MEKELLDHHINWIKALAIMVLIIMCAGVYISMNQGFTTGEPPANYNWNTQTPVKLTGVIVSNFAEERATGKFTASFTLVGDIPKGEKYMIFRNNGRVGTTDIVAGGFSINKGNIYIDKGKNTFMLYNMKDNQNYPYGVPPKPPLGQITVNIQPKYFAESQNILFNSEGHHNLNRFTIYDYHTVQALKNK